MKHLPVSLFVFVLCLFFSVVFVAAAQEKETPAKSTAPEYSQVSYPLKIPVMQHMNFPGSDLVIEEILPKSTSSDRYIVSYLSEHKKIQGLLVMPRGFSQKKLPAILMAHGYVPPREYKNSEQYSDFIEFLAQNGYIVFMPDFRGNGESEGNAVGAYFSPGYTIDFLNAFSSLARQEDVDSERIGVWGHSMGGNIVLRSIIVQKDIKSAVIWSGVVGSYIDLLYHWNSNTAWNSHSDTEVVKPDKLITIYGDTQANPSFWHEISPTSYLHNISIPIQLHHAVEDRIVPAEFSQKLETMLEKENKQTELYLYSHANHDMVGSDTPTIWYRTLHFYNSTLQ